MIQVPLQAVANQALSMTLGLNMYDIVVRLLSANDSVTADIMGISVSVNDNPIVSGQRCSSHVPVFWSDSMTPPDGSNFVWISPNGADPKFDNFTETGNCRLFWVTPEELAELQLTANVL